MSIIYRQGYGIWALGLLCVLWVAHPTKSKRALRLLERGAYLKTEALLQEILEEDTLNPAAYYVYARLYSTDTFLRYQIDTAHSYIQRALQQWGQLDAKSLKKHAQQGFTQLLFEELHIRIDSLGYEKAVATGTLEAYLAFLERYTLAVQRTQALRSRDSLAFAAAAASHSIPSYQDFMENYPQALEQAEALRRYQALRFEGIQKKPNLRDWQHFLKEFPSSEEQKHIESEILELLTLRATPESFLYFLESYPRSAEAKKAFQLLASIDRHWYEGQYQGAYLSLFPAYADSLKKVAHTAPLIPIRGKKGYGFIDYKGRLRIAPQYDSVAAAYFCEGLRSPYLLVHGQEADELRSREGQLVLRGPITALEPITEDILRIQLNGKYGLWHLSAGELLPPRYSDISYLPAGLLRLKAKYKVGISSLLGRMLLPLAYEDAYQEGPFLILEQEEGVEVALPEVLARELQAGAPLSMRRFDKVEVVEEKYLLATKKKEHMLLDSTLETLFSEAGAHPQRIGSYWLIEEGGNYRLFHERLCESSAYLSQVAFNSAWLVLQQQDGRYGLLSFRSSSSDMAHSSLQQVPFLGTSLWVGYDSLYLVGQHAALGRIEDQQWLHFTERAPRRLPTQARIHALSSPTASSLQENYAFYRLIDGEKHQLINHKGRSVSVASYNRITPIDKHYLIVESAPQEKGIIDHRGKLQVPLIHGTISYPNFEGRVSLLQDGQFGSFQIHNGAYLPADYESVPTSWGNIGWKVRYKDKVGVLSTRRKTIIPFDYEDLLYCGSTRYLSQEKELKYLRSYQDKDSVEGPFYEYRLIQGSSEQKWVLLRGEKGWGLIDKDGRWMIEPQYDRIQAIGQKKFWAFLAMRYVEDADLYLNIYFSSTGARIFSESYAEAPLGLHCKAD